MTVTMAEMMARYAGPGKIDAVFLRADRKSGVVSVSESWVSETGLSGDHGRAGKRAVTLMQAEHVAVIAALAKQIELEACLLRRNLVVSGLNILALRGRQILVGDAVIELTVPCHPCSRMESVLGHGGYSAMRGHGGFCASVIRPGYVRIGDKVEPV